MIQAIETEYKGYLFRSRLEARWAVFFDELGADWEYEPEGFKMDSIWYLPDFLVKENKMPKAYIEIKPDMPPYEDALMKASELAKRSQIETVVFWGTPYQYFGRPKTKNNPEFKYCNIFGLDGKEHTLDSIGAEYIVGAIESHKEYMELSNITMDENIIFGLDKIIKSMLRASAAAEIARKKRVWEE